MNDLKRLLKYVRPYWFTFTVAFFAMFAAALFETAAGAMLVPIFDQFIPNRIKDTKTLFDLNSLIPQNDWYRAWLIISVLLLTFTILKGVAEYVSSFLMAKIGQSAILRLREELYDHVLKQSAVFFEKHRTNYIVSRLVVNCSAIEHAVSTNLRDVIRESFMLTCFIGAAFYFNWRLTLGALIIAPMIAYLTSNFSRRLRKLADVSLEGNKTLNDTSQEALANQTIVKAYAAEEREQKRFMAGAQVIAQANLRSASIAATSPPIIELIGVVAIILLLFFGLREINAARLDPPQFFTFLLFLLRSYDPMRKIARQHNEVSKAFAAARDVWEILDEDETLPEKSDAKLIGPLSTSIRLENVSFNYRNSKKKTIKNVNLEIYRGQTVALVGQSGGGYRNSLHRPLRESWNRLFDALVALQH